MLYYLFFLDVFFLSAGITPNSENYNHFGFENISNKFLIITSLIFFYLIPIIYSHRKNVFNFENINLKIIIIILLIFGLGVYFFNYKLEYTGGGIFFRISNIIFENLFFYFIFLVSIYFVYIKYFNLNNLILIFLLFLSNPQITIYHKYYDPLLLILFFTLFNLKINTKYFNYNNLIVMYLFYSVFIFSNLIKKLF